MSTTTIKIDEGSGTAIDAELVGTAKRERNRLGGEKLNELQHINPEGAAWMMAGCPVTKTFRANYTGAAQTNTKVVTATAGKKIIVTKASVRFSRNVPNEIDVLMGLHATTTPTGADCFLAASEVTGGDPPIQEGDGSGAIAIAPLVGDDILLTTSGALDEGSIDVLVTYWEFTPS